MGRVELRRVSQAFGCTEEDLPDFPTKIGSLRVFPIVTESCTCPYCFPLRSRPQTEETTPVLESASPLSVSVRTAQQRAIETE